jgi:hypothetical protein
MTEGKFQVFLILWSERRGRNGNAGEIDTFMGAELSAGDDPEDNLGFPHGNSGKLDLPVIKKNTVSRAQVIGKIVVRGRNGTLIP